jgi:biopolymer transport protein ExbD
MNLRPRRAEEPEINLVSLIDVVLMVVIFFMLSSTFVDEGRLQIRLPEASEAPLPRIEGGPIVLSISESGGYRINDRELINSSPDTLRTAILKIALGDRSAPVTVRADGRASHQSVVTAMDVLGPSPSTSPRASTGACWAMPGRMPACSPSAYSAWPCSRRPIRHWRTW